MTWPESTPIRRWRILALAAAFLLAALVEAGPATAQAAEPPPVSCIADNPVDPLGPGFLLDRGEFTTIDHPKATLETAPYGINNRGQIAGIYADADRTTHAFLRDQDGVYTTIDVPGASVTFPFGINNRGHVVGFYMDANQVRHGFLFKNGALTTIDHPLASSDSQAHDLNDRGQIVGLYERAAGQAVEAREGASRSRSGPTHAEDIGSAHSPLTRWWTVSGTASLK